MRLAWLLALAGCSPPPVPYDEIERLMDGERWAEAWRLAPDEYTQGVILHQEHRNVEALACLWDTGPSEDLAFVFYALDRDMEAAGVFGQLLSDDPLSVYNLASALHGGGEDAESLLWETLERSGEWDPVHVMALEDLAEELAADGEQDHAIRVAAQAEYLRGRIPWQTSEE